MKKLIILAVTFIALEAADAGVTLWATNNGYVEGNPLLASFAHTWAQPVIKMAMAFLVVWMLLLVNRRSKTRKPAIVGFVGVIALQVFALSSWMVTLLFLS